MQKKEQEKKAIKDRQEERAALTEGGDLYQWEKGDDGEADSPQYIKNEK